MVNFNSYVKLPEGISSYWWCRIGRTNPLHLAAPRGGERRVPARLQTGGDRWCGWRCPGGSGIETWCPQTWWLENTPFIDDFAVEPPLIGDFPSGSGTPRTKWQFWWEIHYWRVYNPEKCGDWPRVEMSIKRYGDVKQQKLRFTQSTRGYPQTKMGIWPTNMWGSYTLQRWHCDDFWGQHVFFIGCKGICG